MSSLQSKWLIFAIASGACAAMNGVFAKLTTTSLTTSWADALSHLFGLAEPNKVIEYLVRGFFFALNLVFDAIMWGLFTRALTLASSTVRVSIINTSANFMITAFMGWMIFSEALPGLWWLGASMLVIGNLIIGRSQEGDKVAVVGTANSTEAGLVAEDDPDAPLAGYASRYARYSDDFELTDARESSSDDDKDTFSV